MTKYIRTKGPRILLMKILCLFMLLIILPTLSLGLYYYNVMTHNLEEEITGRNEDMLEHVKKNMDHHLARLEKDMLTLALNEQVLEVLSYSKSLESHILNVATVRRLMDTQITSTNILESIYLYINKNKKVLSNDYYGELEGFYDNNFMESILTTDRVMSGSQRDISIPMGENKTIASMFKTLPINSTPIKGYLVFNWDCNVLTKILSRSNTSPSSELFMVNINKDQLTVGTHNYSPYLELLDKDTLKSQNDIMYFKDFICIKEASDYKDYYYLSIIPMDYIAQETSIIKQTVLSICSILILIGIAISYILSRYLYNPIDDLMSIIKEDMDSNKSSTTVVNELSYVKEAIHHYKNNTLMASHVLNRNRESIKDTLFQTLLKGSYINMEDMQRDLQWLDISMPHKHFVLIALSIDKDTRKQKDAYYQFDHFAAVNIAEEFLCKSDSTGVGFNWEHRKLALILNYKDNVDYFNLALTVKQTIESYLEIHLKMGLGEPVNDLLDLPHTVASCFDVLEHNIMANDNKFYSIQELEQHKDLNSYILEESGRIANNILGQNPDKAKQLSKDYLCHMATYEDTSIEILRYTTLQMCTLIIKSISLHNTSYRHNLHENNSWITSIQEMETLPEIEQWMTEFIDSVCGNIQVSSHSNNDHFITRVMDFIEKNYSEPIGVAEIADYLNITPQHLSRQYKSKTGETLISYLSNYRLTKASELIINTNTSIQDVANLCGFTDAKYFSKRYKQFFGITPKKHRESQ